MNTESGNWTEDAAAMSAPTTLDHFAVLGVSRQFDLDLDALEDAYLERSKKVHPDRFVNAETSERVASLSASMQANDAYKTLKSPAKRGEHLLALHGVAIGEGEKLDPGFLMEILEAREELAEAMQNGDEATVNRLEESMLDRKDAILENVSKRFAEVLTIAPGADAGSKSEHLQAIKRELIVLRYVERYLEATVSEL